MPQIGHLPPKAERPKLIIETAIELFAANGPEAVTMDDVAAACGLTKPRLYDLFASKEALLTGAVAAEAARFERTVLGAYEAAFGDPRAEVEAFSRAAIAYAIERPGGVRLLRSSIANQSATIREPQRRSHARVAAVISERIRKWAPAKLGRSAELVAEMLLGMSLASIDHRLEHDLPINANLAELHAASSLAILRNLDLELLERIDREG